jgi:hypothetical protein
VKHHEQHLIAAAWPLWYGGFFVSGLALMLAASPALSTKIENHPARTPALNLSLLDGENANDESVANRENVFRVSYLPHTQPDAQMRQLYEALELELVLNEQLIMVPPETIQEVIQEEANTGIPQQLQIAMIDNNIDAVIRTRQGRYTPILQIHRAIDGGTILAKAINLPLTQKQIETLYQEIQLTIQELNELPALSPLALSVLDAAPTAPQRATDRPADSKPGSPGRSADSATSDSQINAKDKTANATAGDENDDSTSAEGAAPLDKLGRLVLSGSPAFLSYQACQPPANSLPFSCDNREEMLSSSTLVLPFGGWASGHASLEMYPWVPYLGWMLSGSLFQSQLAFSKSIYNVPSVNILGGHLQSTFMGRGVFELGFLTLGLGLRLGYQLLFAIVDDHYIEFEDDDEIYPVTLLPSYLVHSALVGITSTIQILKWVRLHFDGDIVPAALAQETPTTLGDNPLSVGLHSKIQLDLDLFWGLLLSVHAEGTLINTNTTGEGNRLTRTLVPFRSGRSVLLQGQIGSGIGFHF